MHFAMPVQQLVQLPGDHILAASCMLRAAASTSRAPASHVYMLVPPVMYIYFNIEPPIVMPPIHEGQW